MVWHNCQLVLKNRLSVSSDQQWNGSQHILIIATTADGTGPRGEGGDCRTVTCHSLSIHGCFVSITSAARFNSPETDQLYCFFITFLTLDTFCDKSLISDTSRSYFPWTPHASTHSALKRVRSTLLYGHQHDCQTYAGKFYVTLRNKPRPPQVG